MPQVRMSAFVPMGVGFVVPDEVLSQALSLPSGVVNGHAKIHLSRESDKRLHLGEPFRLPLRGTINGKWEIYRKRFGDFDFERLLTFFRFADMRTLKPLLAAFGIDSQSFKEERSVGRQPFPRFGDLVFVLEDLLHEDEHNILRLLTEAASLAATFQRPQEEPLQPPSPAHPMPAPGAVGARKRHQPSAGVGLHAIRKRFETFLRDLLDPAKQITLTKASDGITQVLSLREGEVSTKNYILHWTYDAVQGTLTLHRAQYSKPVDLFPRLATLVLTAWMISAHEHPNESLRRLVFKRHDQKPEGRAWINTWLNTRFCLALLEDAADPSVISGDLNPVAIQLSHSYFDAIKKDDGLAQILGIKNSRALQSV